MGDTDHKVALGDDGEVTGLPKPRDVENAQEVALPAQEKRAKRGGSSDVLRTFLGSNIRFEFTTTRTLDACIKRLRRTHTPEADIPLYPVLLSRTAITVSPDSDNTAQFSIKFMRRRYEKNGQLMPWSVYTTITGDLDRLEKGDTLVKGEIIVANRLLLFLFIPLLFCIIFLFGLIAFSTSNFGGVWPLALACALTPVSGLICLVIFYATYRGDLENLRYVHRLFDGV
jgi:hypothetical protein